ncbi:MAG: class II aldolase/adducin family protein [Ignavibacteriales bacterium]|nr:class II aldolase/adducin family protein [Ignavibacteriales bacterium]
MESKNQNIEILIDICHRLYANRFVAATDGNVSVRLDNGNFLTTRTAINKGMVTAEDLIEIDFQGNITLKSGIRNSTSEIRNGEPSINPHPSSLESKPSTEVGMHIYIYSQRTDVNAVVHAHPPYATGFATARQPLNDCLLPEVIVGLGAIPLAEYATPSTDEVVKSLEPYVKTADAILLANHGVVTYGKDLWDAYFKMEKAEHAAHITYIARMLGGEKPLNQEEVEKLRAISNQSYGKDFSNKIACQTSCSSEEKSVTSPSDDEIREIVKKMLTA